MSSGAFAAFGSGTVIEPPLRITGEKWISLGRGVFIGAGSWLEAIEGEPESVRLEIGDGTSIAGNCVISAAASVRIGQAVLMARNVYISDHNHAFEDCSRPVIEQGFTDSKPVSVGEGAWLGENVAVLPGVQIGKGCVVGANAVVAEDLPDYSVAVGVPARVVRRLDRTEG